jgi:hypothetical protein
MLVGNGPLKDELFNTARALGVGGRLELHERVAHHEVPDYIGEWPSCATIADNHEMEGAVWARTGRAMACEVPVVGSDSGAIPGDRRHGARCTGGCQAWQMHFRLC